MKKTKTFLLMSLLLGAGIVYMAMYGKSEGIKSVANESHIQSVVPTPPTPPTPPVPLSAPIPPKIPETPKVNS